MRRTASTLILLGALAACGAARADEVPPLADAEVGEWALYRGIAEGSSTRMEVVAVEGRRVTIEVVTRPSGEAPATTRTHVFEVPVVEGPAPAEAPATPLGHEEVLVVAGRSLRCTVREAGPTRTWTCAEVPCLGVVRVDVAGVRYLDLVDLGRRGEPGLAPRRATQLEGGGQAERLPAPLLPPAPPLEASDVAQMELDSLTAIVGLTDAQRPKVLEAVRARDAFVNAAIERSIERGESLDDRALSALMDEADRRLQAAIRPLLTDPQRKAYDRYHEETAAAIEQIGR